MLLQRLAPITAVVGTTLYMVGLVGITMPPAQALAEDAPATVALLQWDQVPWAQVKQIVINGSELRLHLEQDQNQPQKKRAQVEDGAKCTLGFSETEGTLTVNAARIDGSASGVTAYAQRPLLKIVLRESIDTVVRVSGGLKADIQQWDKLLDFEMNHGVVGFSRVRSLNLRCQSCDLSGEDALGEVIYDIGVGTVGMKGLRDSVKGRSTGDVILRWSHLRARADIDVLTKHGDISMELPRSADLELDIQAPNGDIILRNAKVGGRGMQRVKVTAEKGNVRLSRR